jgi:hypothetical protein
MLSKPELSRTLFWDVDYESLDFDKNAAYIVERVLNRGSVQDFKSILKFYGFDQLKNIVLNLRYLDKKALHFSSAFFNVPLQKFRCYTEKQLNRTHWNY